MTLWLDKRSFLVRKVFDAWRSTDGSMTRMTANYASEGNTDVYAHEFEIEPPY